MTLLLGEPAPDFTADSTAGALSFHAWQGGDWVVLFSYPRDFTPVCSSELVAAARMAPEFAARGAKLLAVGVGEVADHRSWADELSGEAGCPVDLPIVADPYGEVAALYRMVHPAGGTQWPVRCTYLVDPDHRIAASQAYPAPLGRDFGELLRLVDAAALNRTHGLNVPAGWQPGGDVFLPSSLSDDEATARFGDAWRRVSPRTRMVRSP